MAAACRVKSQSGPGTVVSTINCGFSEHITHHHVGRIGDRECCRTPPLFWCSSKIAADPPTRPFCAPPFVDRDGAEERDAIPDALEHAGGLGDGLDCM